MRAATALCTAALVLVPVAAPLAQGTAPAAAAATVIPAAAVRWGPAPANLPAGAQLAVIEGDPSKAGPYTIRLRLPAGYRFPAHTHPGSEHVTVMSGTLLVAAGDRLDGARMQTLAAGSYTGIPADVRHVASARGETVLQIHGNGPFGIDYLNKADDPASRSAPPR
jgi:quercetin dioxygenase-like cupin family protein